MLLNLFAKITAGFLAIVLIIMGCHFAEDSIYLIPDGYEGPVFVIFDQPAGNPEKYENGDRVYEIPSNGILRTQFPPNRGRQKIQFFYSGRDGIRKPLLYKDKSELLRASKDSIYVFDHEMWNTTEFKDRNENNAVRYMRFIVGKVSHRDSLYEVMNSMKIE